MHQDINKLKHLKNKLAKGEMSVLIGSGFSKNIDKDMFPTWWELLYDLTYELCRYEIDEQIKNISSTENKKKETDRIIGNYLDKEGYLNVVSKYIKKKGYREAITTYIEDRTPYIDNRKGEKYLINKSRNIEKKLNPNVFNLHKMLLNLNWNNIYTTNYDTMLEEAYDFNMLKEMEVLKIDLITEINNIENDLKELKKEVSHFEKITEKIKEAKGNEIIGVNQKIDDNKVSNISDEEKNYYNQIANLNGKIFSLERQVEYKTKELEKVELAIYSSITIVKSSSDLSVKRNRNIIKLHGSLRELETEYGFDFDNKLQYIIAKEDYQSYPQKHEAFTQLMRISLLQESFCLIGFSGNDPNFIEWVKWVRDILSRNTENKSEPKIFLININSTKDDEEGLKLFYQNYKIAKISLAIEEVRNFLTDKTEVNNDNGDTKKLFESFFTFLDTGNYSAPKNFIETKRLEEYHNSWKGASIKYQDFKSSIKNIIDNYNLIKSNGKQDLIYDYSNHYTNNNQRDIIYLLSSIIVEAEEFEKQKILEVFLLAIKNLSIPYDLILCNENKNDLKRTELECSRFKLGKKLSYLKNISNLINVKPMEDNKETYLDILFCLFSFDFEGLQKRIENWKPRQSVDIIRKAGLLSFFDCKKGFDYLKLKKEKFDFETFSYQLYYNEYCKYFNPQIRFDDDIFSDSFKKIKRLGFESVFEIISNQINGLKEDEEKINKYGYNRFSTSVSWSLSKDENNIFKATRVLNLMVDFCIPISFTNTAFIDYRKWYKVFQLIYEYYPFPSLLYSLYFNDEKMIRRIAQDFIFSKHLENEVNLILPKILKAYLNKTIPIRIRRSAIILCSELLVSVPVRLWENHFEQLYKSVKFKDQIFDSVRNEEYYFFVEGIKYLQDAKLIMLIVKDLIQLDTSVALNLLTKFFANPNLKQVLNKNSSSLYIHITNLIKTLDEKELNLFYLNSLDSLLNDSQKVEITNKVDAIKYKIQEPNSYEILCKFSIDINKIKSKILNSNNFLNIGFTEKTDGNYSYSRNNKLVLLSSLDNLNLSKNELKIILEKIKSEFNKVQKFTEKIYDVSFYRVLSDMYYFIKRYETIFSKEQGFSEFKKDLKKIYIKQKGYNSITEAFLSKDDNVISYALYELSHNLEMNIEKSQSEESIKKLINRVLLFQNNKLEDCIAYLTFFVKKESILKDNIEDLLLILKVYHENSLKGLDKIFVYNQMIRLAQLLDKHIEDTYINKWLDIYKLKRYNYLMN